MNLNWKRIWKEYAKTFREAMRKDYCTGSWRMQKNHIRKAVEAEIRRKTK